MFLLQLYNEEFTDLHTVELNIGLSKSNDIPESHSTALGLWKWRSTNQMELHVFPLIKDFRCGRKIDGREKESNKVTKYL